MEMRQGSPEWLNWRSRLFTSTSPGSVEGVNPYETAQQWLEKKVRAIHGVHEDLSHVPAVKHGSENEAISIAWFEKEWGLSGWDQPYQMHRDHDWMMSSIDRRWGLKTGGEFKNPFARYTKEPYSVHDKPAYLLQCRHHMEVCDLDTLHFVCFISPEKFHVDTLDRDYGWLDELLPGKLLPKPRSEAVRRVDLYHAWLNYALDEAADPAKRDVYLKGNSKGFKDVQDVELDEIQSLMLEDQRIDNDIKPSMERKTEIKARIDTLKSSVSDKYDESVTNGTVRFQVIKRKGTVDYARAFQEVGGEDLLAANGKRPDDFRRAGSKTITLSMEKTT